MKLLFTTFCCSLFLILSAQQKDSVKVEIKNVGPLINSPYPDYAPLISADGCVMVFTSRIAPKKNLLVSKKALDNVYVTYYDDRNKKWLFTVMLGPLINIPEIDNSAIALSNDGQRMLLYRGGNAVNSTGDILESQLSGEEWSEPVRLPAPINSDDNETSASISPDGGTIYFVSDRKGGLGGKDIWYCTQDENGALGEAINMGPSINTDKDEEGVFIHPNGGAIFFSSKGHNSMGGYDIFMSVYDETTKTWTKAENLGSPINTPDNDIYFVLQANGKTGYYASSKPGGLGDLDIYNISFSEDIMKKNIVLLKGRVVNKNRSSVESIIDITNKATGKLVGTFKSNKASGKYLVSLPAGKKYEIEINANGYSTYTESFDIPYKIGYGEIVKDIVLDSKNAFIFSRVLDEKGTPITNVMIEATEKGTKRMLEKSETNSAGHSLIPVPPGKTYDIVFSKAGYSFQMITVVVPDSAGYERDLKDIVLRSNAAANDSLVTESSQKEITKESVVKQNVTNLVSSVVEEKEPVKEVKKEELSKKEKKAQVAAIAAAEKEAKKEAKAKKNEKAKTAAVAEKEPKEIVVTRKMKAGEKIILNDILFDFNKSKPQKESLVELERAIKLVNEIGALPIEISGHTDNVGTRRNNRKVSLKRAKTVANYLTDNNVDKKRISYKGYGETQPIASNATEQGRQLNRRTEIKVLNVDGSTLQEAVETKTKPDVVLPPIKKEEAPVTQAKKEEVVVVKKEEVINAVVNEVNKETNNVTTVAKKETNGTNWSPNLNTSTIADMRKEESSSDKMQISNIGMAVNSPFPDYAPLISADGNTMIFTSQRPLAQKDIEKGKNGPENVYATYYDSKNKKWLVTLPLGSTINTAGIDNSAIALSNDGQWMLLYRGGNAINSNGDILESTLSGDEWSEPMRLPPPINSEDNETSASISPDGRTIYFVSDRKGGFGGRDIWFCTQDENKNWGEPVNMGVSINTADDEEGVFIHPSGNALFFSSKGHDSKGGYDIFMSVFDETTRIWSKAENLGSPINTVGDDIYFTLEANGKTGFYASSKFGGQGGPGDLDIYNVTFNEDLTKRNSTLLKGRVVAKDGTSVESLISIKNKLTGKLIGTFKSNKSTGKYLVSLPPGKKYEIEVSSNGYSTYTESIDIPYKTSYGEIVKDILLEVK